MKASFQIPTKYLKAVSLFASDDETRYVLCSVQVEIKGAQVLLIATNGRSLLVIDASGEVDRLGELMDGAFLISRDLLSAMPEPAVTGKRRMVTVSCDGNDVSIEGALYKIVDGRDMSDAKYPNWRLVIPSHAPTKSEFALDSEFVADFGRAAKMLYNNSQISMFQCGDLGPFIVKTEHPEFFGVMMPCRTSAVNSIPSYVK